MALVIYRNKNSQETEKVISMVNFNIILILSMAICNAIGAYYLLMRYFSFVYAFQNTLIIIYLNKSKFMHNDAVRVSLIVIFILYFFYNLANNIFSYASIGEAIVYPAPLHIL